MKFSEATRSFFMKCFIIATSVIVAALIAQMIIVMFLAVLYFVPSVSNLARIASALLSELVWRYLSVS